MELFAAAIALQRLLPRSLQIYKTARYHCRASHPQADTAIVSAIQRSSFVLLQFIANMSHAKIVSRNLLSPSRLIAATVLLSLVAISQAAPFRQQRGVFASITVGTKPPTNSAAPDCSQAKADRIALHGTQDEKDMYAALAKDYQNGKILTFDDLELVYTPRCKIGSHETDRFTEIQCFTPVHSWPAELPRLFCWCANSTTGYPINGTITEGLIDECSVTVTPPKSCRVEDKEIPHGASYKAEGICQNCTCFNGVTTCEKTLSSDEGDNFTADALYLLKVQLLKRLYVQKQNAQASSAEIIREMKLVTDQSAIDEKNNTLDWQWDRMGKHVLGHLYPGSIRRFAIVDVSQFTCSFTLVSKFEALLDVNGDRRVNQTEFTDFFDLTKNEVHLQRIVSCLSPDSTSGASGVNPSC